MKIGLEGLLKQNYVLLGIIILLLPMSTAFAQSDFIKKGENGIGVNFGFLVDPDISGFAVQLCYSTSGMSDIGFTLGKFSNDDMDLRQLYFAPSLSFYAIKQKLYRFPLSLSFKIAYQVDSYSGKYLKQRGLKMDGHSLLIGCNFLSNINWDLPITYQPNGSMFYIIGTTNINNDEGDRISKDENSVLINLGISLFINTSSNLIIRVDPSISINENDTMFSIGVGIIFPIRKRENAYIL